MQSCSAREIDGTCREPQGDSYVSPVAMNYCRLPTGSWGNGDTECNLYGLELGGLHRCCLWGLDGVTQV